MSTLSCPSFSTPVSPLSDYQAVHRGQAVAWLSIRAALLAAGHAPDSRGVRLATSKAGVHASLAARTPRPSVVAW